MDSYFNSNIDPYGEVGYFISNNHRPPYFLTVKIVDIHVGKIEFKRNTRNEQEEVRMVFE